MDNSKKVGLKMVWGSQNCIRLILWDSLVFNKGAQKRQPFVEFIFVTKLHLKTIYHTCEFGTFSQTCGRSRTSILSNGLSLRSYLSTIPTYNSHFISHLNSHLLFSRSGNSFFRSGNSFLKNSHFSKKEFLLLLNRKWESKWEF